MLTFLAGIATGVTALAPLAAYLWRCNAPLRAHAKVGRARLEALARAKAKKVGG